MKDPFLIIGYMLLALMISFEANALSKEEIKEQLNDIPFDFEQIKSCLLYTSPSPRD